LLAETWENYRPACRNLFTQNIFWVYLSIGGNRIQSFSGDFHLLHSYIFCRCKSSYHNITFAILLITFCTCSASVLYNLTALEHNVGCLDLYIYMSASTYKTIFAHIQDNYSKNIFSNLITFTETIAKYIFLAFPFSFHLFFLFFAKIRDFYEFIGRQVH
jgi:hypothetical protein